MLELGHIAFIPDKGMRPVAFHENLGLCDVRALPLRKREFERISKRINGCMYFCGKATAASAKCFSFACAFFAQPQVDERECSLSQASSTQNLDLAALRRHGSKHLFGSSD